MLMNRTIKQLAIIAIISLLTGCVFVPKTTISGNIGGHPFALSSPKDTTLTGLNIVAETNGSVQIVVSHLQSKMNPDVISTTAQGQVDLINAVSSAVQQAMAAGAAQSAK